MGQFITIDKFKLLFASLLLSVVFVVLVFTFYMYVWPGQWYYRSWDGAMVRIHRINSTTQMLVWGEGWVDVRDLK